MKNKYFYRSRISKAKFREVGQHFVMDINANKTAYRQYDQFYLLKNKNYKIYKYSRLFRV